jgi:hypothetical protein
MQAKRYAIIHSPNHSAILEPTGSERVVTEFARLNRDVAREHFKDLRDMNFFNDTGDGTLYLVEVLDSYRNTYKYDKRD